MRLDESQMIDTILKAVVYFYDTTPEAIKRKTRKQEIREPRQIAHSLCYVFTTNTLHSIGHNIGGLDHATVLHSIKTVINQYEQNSSYAMLIDKIISLINHRMGTRYDFTYVTNYKDKIRNKYQSKKDLLSQFNNKVQELMLTFHTETILEIVNELKEIDLKISHQFHSQEIIQDAKEQKTN